jgi:NAD(P)H-flavin reductase
VRLLGLRLLAPDSIDFAAGQFVTFRVDAADGRRRLSRAYSIASAAGRQSSIDLIFNLVPNGPGSSYLYGRQIGDVVEFSGPSGTFVLAPPADRELLFVATGTGIAPFRSMIPAALERGQRATLFWGVRSERDLYLQDEWTRLAARYAGFTFTTTLSQPSPQWEGASGRVQRLIEGRITSVDRLEVYLCGSSAMIASVTSLIQAVGRCPIYREQYYLDR